MILFLFGIKLGFIYNGPSSGYSFEAISEVISEKSPRAVIFIFGEGISGMSFN